MSPEPFRADAPLRAALILFAAAPAAVAAAPAPAAVAAAPAPVAAAGWPHSDLPEGVPTKTHVLNLLHRLVDGKVIGGPPLDTPQALALHREPKANVER